MSGKLGVTGVCKDAYLQEDYFCIVKDIHAVEVPTCSTAGQKKILDAVDFYVSWYKNSRVSHFFTLLLALITRLAPVIFILRCRRTMTFRRSSVTIGEAR